MSEVRFAVCEGGGGEGWFDCVNLLFMGGGGGVITDMILIVLFIGLILVQSAWTSLKHYILI